MEKHLFSSVSILKLICVKDYVSAFPDWKYFPLILDGNTLYN